MKILNIIKFIFVVLTMCLLIPMIIAFFFIGFRSFLEGFLNLNWFYFLTLINGGIIFAIDVIQRRLELKNMDKNLLEETFEY